MESLPPLHVAFAAAVTQINFCYFLSTFFILLKITPTLFIDLCTLQQQIYFETVNR